jgi:hypothetical protein
MNFFLIDALAYFLAYFLSLRLSYYQPARDSKPNPTRPDPTRLDFEMFFSIDAFAHSTVRGSLINPALITQLEIRTESLLALEK